MKLFSTVMVVSAWSVSCVAVETPTPHCQALLDSWCNDDMSCVHSIEEHDFSLPLFARFDQGDKINFNQPQQRPADDDAKAAAAAAAGLKEWRCYSPSSLSADLSHYTNGSAYCSRGAQLLSLLDECANPPNGSSVLVINATDVFSDSEVTSCGYIRTPQPVILANGTVVLLGQCRVADSTAAAEVASAASSSSPPSSSKGSPPLGLGDDFRRTRMVLKSSHDEGRTWGPMNFVSDIGTGVGVAIVDRARDTLVFQYQTMPNVDPYENNTLWQKVSVDGGASWTQAVDLTPQLAACNGDAKLGMVCGAAGSRIQASNGRLVFAGHNEGNVCVWFSDDGACVRACVRAFVPSCLRAHCSGRRPVCV